MTAPRPQRPPVPVVRFEGVSKRYLIQRRADRAPHSDLGPRLWSAVRRAFGRPGSAEREEVWALRDVNFEVGRGEVFGIVGANGAGKSTLLKLLSRVTPPTSGWIGVNGRLASLLEVGTGFHPELTGRENVFLNGVLLGLSVPEIRRRFDRIVEFSGVERYIDTPVKRFSSGMYVRLAFAIAAHLDHELMIVDEVLAVGDASFRERCLTVIEEAVRDEGRTVLFVSHDLGQIKRLAQRAMLLEAGQVKALGPVSDVVAEYLKGALAPVLDGTGTLRARVESPDGQPLERVASGSACSLVIDLGTVPANAHAELGIDDPQGRRLWSGSTGLAEGPAPLRCTFAALPLTAGNYGLKVTLRVAGHMLAERSAGDLVVVHGQGEKNGEGPLAMAAKWARD